MIRKRRGFTLLEMLTAIILIVMLSAVMMMSTLEVSASAEARNIISDMNLIRTAALMWYKENSSRIVIDSNQYKIKTNGTKQLFSEFIRDHSSEIMKYIDKNSSAVLRYKSGTNNTGDYSLIAVNNSKQWYVCCNLSQTKDNSDMEAPYMKLKSKFAGNAETLGLKGKINLTDDNFADPYTGQQFVCLHVLTLAK